MLLKKSQAQAFTIDGGTSGLIFPSSPKGDQTIAFVEMDGTYPAKGYSLNDFCTETICLLEGEFNAEVGGKNFTVKPDDILIILPGNKYKIIGKGKSIDLITPAWDKKQNHIINE